jgi:predicted nuclease with TOPRIM domain
MSEKDDQLCQWMEALQAENTDLRQRLQQMEKERDNCAEAFRKAEDSRRRYGATIRAYNNVNNGEYYAWIPDEDNHLESLSGSICINANELRLLINSNTTDLRQRLQRYEAVVEALHDGLPKIRRALDQASYVIAPLEICEPIHTKALSAALEAVGGLESAVHNLEVSK